MKPLPILPFALLGLALALAACSTPANRRELYNTANANGPWHDYERRLDATEETGVAAGDMGHTAVDLSGSGNNLSSPTGIRNRPTPVPKSAPLLPDSTSLPSNAPAPATVPNPATVPASPTSPTTTDPSAPVAPGSTNTAPPADPTAVPANPPAS